MYESYYHMRSKAFPAQPTPAVFFESRIHQGAFRYLTTGVEEHEPFLLVLGRYGMGKTLLCLRLLRHLREHEHPFLNIAAPVVSYRELLEHILYSWGVTPQGDSEHALQAQLFHYLDQHLTPGRRFSLVLDEMQDYQLSTLAKIRMLSNYNCDGFYPFQFIFFAHNDFLELLNAPPLASLHQRIRRRYTLTPFSFEETREYIYYRLLESGALGSPYFPNDTIRIIHSRTEGIPRIINNLCDACLLIGAAKGLSTIDRQTTLDAAENLGLPTPMSVSDWSAEEPGQMPAPVLAEEAAAPQAPIDEEPPPQAEREPDEETTVQARGGDFQLTDILPPWAWRVVGLVLLCLLVWILAMHVGSLLAPHAPRSRSNSGAGRGVRPTPPAAENQAPDASSLDSLHDQDDTGGTSGRDELLLGVNDSNGEELPARNPSYRQHGLLGYLSDETLDRRRNMTSESAANTGRPTADEMVGADEVAPPPHSTMDAQTPSAVAYPYALRLRTASERRLAVGLLGKLQAQGIPVLYLGRIQSADASAAWAVLQGYYESREAAEHAARRLELEDAAPLETPYAVQIPVANTGDISILGYLREAGYWPYSVPESPASDRLLVGAFETRAMAERWQQEMEARGFEARVISR